MTDCLTDCVTPLGDVMVCSARVCSNTLSLSLCHSFLPFPLSLCYSRYLSATLVISLLLLLSLSYFLYLSDPLWVGLEFAVVGAAGNCSHKQARLVGRGATEAWCTLTVQSLGSGCRVIRVRVQGCRGSAAGVWCTLTVQSLGSGCRVVGV